MITTQYIPQRTSAEIKILRRMARGSKVIHTAPITMDCKRTFKLMEKDAITLSFRTSEPINFAIGDFINDELFGTFYLLDEVMPSYEKNTGTYKYELEFHAPYYRWRNKLFMLTSDLSGERIRKETSWQLTAQLKTHVEEVINNLNVLGLKLDYETYSTKIEYTYSILPSAEHVGEVKYLSYAGVNIIDALKQIADEYECEWWVDESTHTIYFGKCEGTNEPIELELHKNVETMSIKKNESTYANKIFVYGSKENIPESYRKKLEFDFTDYKLCDNDGVEFIYFWDRNRRVTSGMLAGGAKYTLTNTMEVEEVSGTSHQTHRIAYLPFNITAFSTKVSVSGLLKVILSKPYDIGSFEATIKADIIRTKGDSSVASLYNDTITYSAPTGQEEIVTQEVAIEIDTQPTFDASVPYYIRIEVDCKGTLTENAKKLDDARSKPQDPNIPLDQYAQPIYNTSKVGVGFVNEGIACVEEDGTKWCQIYWEKDGERKSAWVTNEYVNDSSVDVYGYVFRFVSGRGATESYPTPQDFDVQQVKHFTLQISDGGSDGLIITKVPFSFFADEYENPSALTMIGERRLQLPVATNGYLAKANVDEVDAVEDVAVFEDIKPHLALVVSSVEERERSDTEEFSDGSQYSWQWIQYVIKLQRLDGDRFIFRRDYIPSGQKLQLYFFSDMEAQEAYEKEGEAYIEGGYLIAGMTFDVDFNQSTQEYTLIRNEEYGAKLPNETLKPKVGDVCILLGWDVRAIESLGLVDKAEKALLEKGNEYLEALEENQFTFDCDMMSNSVINRGVDMPAPNLLTLTDWFNTYTTPIIKEASTSGNLLTGFDENATGWTNLRWDTSRGVYDMLYPNIGFILSPIVKVNPNKVYRVTLSATSDAILQVRLDGKDVGFEKNKVSYQSATGKTTYLFTGAHTAQLAINAWTTGLLIFNPMLEEVGTAYYGLHQYALPFEGTARFDGNGKQFASPEDISNLDPTKEYIVSFWTNEKEPSAGIGSKAQVYKSDSESLDVEWEYGNYDDVLGQQYYAIVKGVTGIFVEFNGITVNAPKIEENTMFMPKELNYEEKAYFIFNREGTRVRVNNEALSTPKETRVLGYELKLDYPYDTPKYTVGETDTYSRLKQIEKEITKLK